MSNSLGGVTASALHRQIASGFLLPTCWYADPEIFSVELERVHRCSWQFATQTGDLKEPGDVYVRNIAGVPIVLTRDGQGLIRGFINMCRHRGHPVVLESGNRPKLHWLSHFQHVIVDMVLGEHSAKVAAE